ncbi:TetR/AcrR family transcriptional regulator [Acetobacterium woodii]|uniref:Transcriptional regulator TetR family n=1 Tax=Acetobacterium woodii (strain ATCC 29683 / DSM 1030 / JCM 2381 / KCTC 1655 / WB1) TaxID=931626 RepID=H6LKW1_ACEWD|nr:TetR/AcrR family transcriptional regulator [Acetobacterium woodii]AFA50070.1 transcriptional regulator TetR family [Acetobacterium woodii DSM 1030]
MKTKEQLLHQAVIMFIENGYDNTSINDITSACNITKGAFYHHFKNKDDVFIQAIQVIIEEIKIWTDKKISSSDNIKELIQNSFDYSGYFSYSKYYDNVNSDTYLVLIDSIKKFPEFKTKVADYIYGGIPLIEEKFREAQQNGEVKKDIDPHFLALQIAVLVEGLMFACAVTGTEASLIMNGKKIAQNIWTMIKN